MTEPYRNSSAYLVDRHVDGGLGDRVAVRHEGRDTSYAELLAATARAGVAWQSLGVRREERVMLCMPDTPQLLAGILGAFRIGAVSYTHLRAHETDSYLVCR